jgi:hypothetical protein
MTQSTLQVLLTSSLTHTYFEFVPKNMAPSLVEYANGSPSGATTFNVSKQPVSSTAPPVCYNGYSAPPSHLEPKCHPLERQTTEQVDGFFLQHWPFKSEKEKKKFVAAGFSRVTCLYFPEALDDRIHFACRLLTILFLIDGQFNFNLFKFGIPNSIFRYV